MLSVSKEWLGLDPEKRETILRFQNEFPIKLGQLSTEFGLIVKKATLPSNISGEIKEVDGSVIIRVNRHDALTRQRYTLAHEISHFLLHRHLLEGGISDDVLYRSAQSNEIEVEANRLAADILMPVSQIQDLYKEYSTVKGELLYQKIAEALNVSTIALKIRLNKI